MVEVKLMGYDFNVNGGLEGKVIYISFDVVGEVFEKGGNLVNVYYCVIIIVECNNL